MTPAREKIKDRQSLAEALAVRRARGEKIVFTNGCFDILHVGHARYLAEARALGDLLVVGLNSDVSVRELKGPARPIVPEDERAEMLAHLAVVDYVCLFDESRPDALIEVVRPHVHAKGGDYRPEDLPEAAVVRKHGGEVVVLSLVHGKSSTNIIEKIRRDTSL
jgi:rfaE bifunctional protein nucleotidyltransferase chain/domain